MARKKSKPDADASRDLSVIEFRNLCDVETPERSYEGDGGWDLALPKDIEIPPQRSIIVPMGIAVSLPPNFCAVLFERSSLARDGVMMFGRLIDSGYQGEIHGMFFNTSLYTVSRFKGERVAQLVPMVFRPNLEMEWREVKKFSRETERGERRMGSSGT